jgi:hypothetical protein
MYLFETLFLAIKEDHRLKVFENRVLRRMVGHKRQEVITQKKLYNEQLYDCYSSPDIVRMIEENQMGRTCD